jgi:hypothetical protein
MNRSISDLNLAGNAGIILPLPSSAPDAMGHAIVAIIRPTPEPGAQARLIADLFEENRDLRHQLDAYATALMRLEVPDECDLQ